MGEISPDLTMIPQRYSQNKENETPQGLPVENGTYALDHFNNILVEDGSTLQEPTLLDVFCKNVKENPTKLALFHDLGHVEIQLTYEELYRQATCLASLIQNKEAETGICSAVLGAYLQQGVALTSLYIASLLLNKTLAVMHLSYTASQLGSCLASLGNPILLSTLAKIESANFNYKYLIFLEEPMRVDDNNAQRVFCKIDPPECEKRIPYCFFTSGSTGTPKGVLLTEKSVLNKNYFGASSYFGLDSSCKTAGIATPGFVPSLNDIWTTFILGGTLYIPPAITRLNLDLLKPWLYKHEITNFFTSTAVAEGFLASWTPQDQLHLSKLKWILFGGEKIQRVNLVGRNFNCSFLYGTSETYEISASILLAGTDTPLPPVGKTIPNISVYILDPGGKAVRIGEKGEIYVSGMGLMEGYVGQKTSTLLDNPFKLNSLMHRTGDVGYWSEEGDLYVTGRIDSLVKIHGIRLDLGEVETVLQKFVGIRQAVVIVRDIQNVKQLIAFCILSNDESSPPTTAQLYDYMEKELQKHAIPAEVHFLPEFPKTASGKIDRMALRTLSYADAAEESEDPKQNGEFYFLIRQIWADVIGIPETTIKSGSNFFFLGGNSMLASKLIRTVNQKFPDIPNSHIYAFPVFGAFVASVLNPGSGRIHIDYEKEAELSLNLQLSLSSQFEKINISNQKTFLSGATGYFGPALLFQLLKTTTQHVTCLIRAKNKPEAEKRIRVALNPHCAYDSFENLTRGRLDIVVGDLSKPFFRLNKTEYKHLIENIDVIFHAAAEVNHIKSYEELRDSTVAMTRNVIQFAAVGKLKQLHYMSSVAVFDGLELPTGSHKYFAQESRLPSEIDPKRMGNGYAQSKWVSEKLVWKAIDAGLPAVIYRIGEIGNHSTLPISNADDALGAFIQACKDMKKMPDTKVSFPFIPLDTAAEWIVRISEMVGDQFSERKCFHIVKEQMDLGDFLMPKNDGEEELPKVTLSEWETEFFANAEFETKQNVGAWLSLDSIKESQMTGGGRRGSVLSNISFIGE